MHQQSYSVTMRLLFTQAFTNFYVENKTNTTKERFKKSKKKSGLNTRGPTKIYFHYINKMKGRKAPEKFTPSMVVHQLTKTIQSTVSLFHTHNLSLPLPVHVYAACTHNTTHIPNKLTKIQHI